MENPIRRVTPLTVLPDIAATAEHYCALGFTRVETGSPGCVGLQAGTSYLLLASTAHMAGDFGADLAASLTGKTIPYIYVDSVATAKARLPASAEVLAEAALAGGSLEAMVRQDGQHLILAEKTRQ